MTTIDISAQLHDNDATTLNVTPKVTGVRIRGTNVVTTLGTAITLTKAANRKMRWRQTSRDVRLLIDGDQMEQSADVPTVTSVGGGMVPITRQNNSTTTITIIGTKFEPTATVMIRSAAGVEVEADDVVVTGTTQIVCTVPVTVSSATYSLRITDTQYALLIIPDILLVSSVMPTITSFTPATGASDSTTTVTITGTGFRTTATGVPTSVQLISDNNTIYEADDVTIVSAVSATFTIPTTLAAGDFDVQVTNPDGEFVVSVSKLTVFDPPIIDTVLPATADNTDLVTVTVEGGLFQAGAAVTLVGPSPATTQNAVGNLEVVGDTTITFTVPAIVATGLYGVQITNPGALRVVAAAALTVT